MRIVVDANLWISAFAFGGFPLFALKHIAQVDNIVTCEPIMEEVRTVLQRKFSLQPSASDPELAKHLSIAARVPITGAVRGICRDPKDDMVLEAALHSNADIILTGDRDLLSLGHFHTARILTARAYLEEQNTG